MKPQFEAKGEVIETFYQNLPARGATKGTLILKLKGTEDTLIFSLYETTSTPSRFQYIRKYIIENNGNELKRGDYIEINFFINQTQDSTYLNITSIHNIKKNG